MKKLLLVALAAVGMAACVQNEELGSVSNGNAIVFDNAFINNATKAAIDGSYAQDKGNFDHFNVWATITNENGTANIFENEAVTKSGNAWYYDAANTQYWIPGNRYSFVGIVDAAEVTVNNVQMPETIKTSLANQKDVLYATHNRSYGGGVVTPVHLQFNHLLAKAKFTVKNEIPAEYSGFTYTVESIDITNADNEAEYTIENGTWAATSTYKAEFGPAIETAVAENPVASHLGYQGKAESNWERLILPAAGKALNIKVNYTLHKDDWYQTYEKELVANLDIEKGRAYNFVLELGAPGDPITFDADVEDWVPEGDKVSSLVTTADQLVSALADSTIDVIYLGEDVNLNSLVSRAADPSLKVAAGRTVVLDLNRHKLSATSTQTDKNYDMIDVRGNLTVKNGTIEYKHEGTDMAWGASINIFNITAGGVLNLEGVTAKNLGGSAMAFVAHLNNWGECTLNVENSTLESTYIAVRVFNSGYDMNNVTIKNSTLKGKFCFWVHNYKAAGDSVGTDETLNLDILNGTNTFDYTGKAPVLYGFNKPLYYSETGAPVVSTTEELTAAIANEATIVLAEGTYVLPTKAQGKELTFIGAGDPANTVIATNTSGSYEGCNYNLDGSTVVFENISITTDNNTYTGYSRCNLTFNNCIINNSLTLYGNTEFNNCTLNVSGDQYNIWTWSAPVATFNGCTFNSDGKALLLYGGGTTVLTVNNCVFNDTGVLPDLKAAIEIGSDYGTSVFELIVNNTVVNGYEITDKGINTGTTLWGNKNSMPQDKLNVVVDGVDVY